MIYYKCPVFSCEKVVSVVIANKKGCRRYLNNTLCDFKIYVFLLDFTFYPVRDSISIGIVWLKWNTSGWFT